MKKPTLKQVAEHCGRPYSTLQKWGKKPEFEKLMAILRKSAADSLAVDDK
jgi:hypothetical protein